MLINPFQPEWQTDLHRFHATLPQGAGLILLIDSAFMPGISEQLNSERQPILLFELLPGCSSKGRNVSPCVLEFDPCNKSLVRLLARCSGWPMLSVLATYESVAQLAKRLAACCIIEVDGQNFNFRYPDTRRLPAIFETLTQQQRDELIGNAIGWHYISRDGSWCSLPLKPNSISLSVGNKIALDEHQFAHLLKDSEPDEMWVQLLDQGAQTHLLPSQRHALLSDALYVADKYRLDYMLKVAWCLHCIQRPYQSDTDALRIRLIKWVREKTGSENETLCDSA